MIKHKSTYREAITVLYPRQKEINREIEIENFPGISKNEEPLQNAWVAKANRHEEIVKEQRKKIEKLQDAINKIIKISNRMYDDPDLITMDLKNLITELNII